MKHFDFVELQRFLTSLCKTRDKTVQTLLMDKVTTSFVALLEDNAAKEKEIAALKAQVEALMTQVEEKSEAAA